jgi:hypothetical protein
MTYLKGNQLYKLRLRTGANKKYKTAGALLKKINEYFDWCDENPLIEQVLIQKPWRETEHYEEYNEKSGKVEKKKRVKHHTHSFVDKKIRRPYTFEGLCNFLNISTETFKNYQADVDKFEVCSGARLIIEQQQYEGAATGFFKEQIVARRLGLVDKKDITTNGDSLSQVTVFQLPDNNRDNAPAAIAPVSQNPEETPK